MDIKTVSPEQYAAWLQSQGVTEEDLPGRLMHDMLRALSKQLNDMGVPDGFEPLKHNLDKVLTDDAMARVLPNHSSSTET